MVKSLPRAVPESQGVPSAALIKFYAALEKQEVHSCMVLRHGKVISEGWWGPYNPKTPHVLFSLSKSFCATALGFAVSEKKLTLEDRLVDHFPELVPAQPSENLKQMRVRDLLTMSTGHETEPWAADGFGRANRRSFMNHPVPHQPGKKFLYNSVATYMCSALVQKQSGMKLTEYLKDRLFEPLGITDYAWETSEEGIEYGGWGLSINTDAIARFGQCCLQDGMWEGKRVIPATWVAMASAKQVENGDGGTNDWGQGYGFQFWRCQADCYRGDGAFGQLCVVIPRLDMVVAVTACVDDIGAELRCIWDDLLPAVSEKGLKPSQDEKKLKAKLASLKLPLAAGDKGAKANAAMAGRWLVEGDGFTTAGVVAGDGSLHFELTGDGESISFAAGTKDWVAGKIGGADVSASCAWKSDGSLAVKIRWTGGTYGQDWICSVSEGKLKIVRRQRGSFAPPEMPDISGSKTN